MHTMNIAENVAALLYVMDVAMRFFAPIQEPMT